MQRARDTGELIDEQPLDQLGRRTRIVLDLVNQLVAAGVDLVSCKESLDTTTPAGRFVLTMFAPPPSWSAITLWSARPPGATYAESATGSVGAGCPTAIGVGLLAWRLTMLLRVWYVLSLPSEPRASRCATLQPRCPTLARAGAWYASGVREVLLNERAYRGGTRGRVASTGRQFYSANTLYITNRK